MALRFKGMYFSDIYDFLCVLSVNLTPVRFQEKIGNGGGGVVQWLERWAGDSNVAGSIPGQATLLSVLRQDSLPPRCLVRQMGT